MASSEIEEYVENFSQENNTKPTQTKYLLFKDFNLNPQLIENTRNALFENPSPVQSLAIPRLLLGMDVIVQAKSGTGKTAVFVLGSIELHIRNGSNTLVFAHTRELVDQINNEFQRFSNGIGIEIGTYENCTVKTNIVIGTPEEINLLINKNVINLKCFTNLVVDECDFSITNPILTKLLSRSLKNLTKWMFSATFTKKTKENCLSYLKSPFEVYVDDDSQLTLHGLRQFYIECKEKEKIEKLKIICELHKNDNIIVFCKRSQNAKYIEHVLKGGSVTPNMAFKEKIEILNLFKRGCFRVLSTTDILSRGIDIQDVRVVVNYDIPENPQTYLHRVGRAGRFESEGVAINFVNGEIDTIRLNEVMDRYEVDMAEIRI